MTTRRLLWGMTWRGTGCGLLAGVLIGALPGMVIVSLVIVFMLVYRNSQIGFAGEELAFGELINLAILVIGTGSGAALGSAIGLSIGLFTGLFTRDSSHSLENVKHYQRLLVTGSMIISLFFSLPIFSYLFFALYPSLASSQKIFYLMLVIVVPVITWGFAATMITLFISRSYIRSTKGANPNA